MYKIILVVLSCIFFTSCFSYKELELGDVSSVKVNKVANGGIEIQAGMQIKNPNGYKIKVKRIDADLFVNGQKIGKINLSKKVVLPRKSDQLQEFNVNTQLSNLISAVPSLLFGGNINLQMKGSIKGKVFIFSKRFPLEAEKNISARDLNIF